MDAGNGEKYLYDAINRKRVLFTVCYYSMAHAGNGALLSLKVVCALLEAVSSGFCDYNMTGPAFEIRTASFRREKTELCRQRAIFPG